MIDENLLNKFNQIEDLPVSEEMLGAYLEGNLDSFESSQIDSLLSNDSQLSNFVDDISHDDMIQLEKSLIDSQEVDLSIFASTAIYGINSNNLEDFSEEEIICRNDDRMNMRSDSIELKPQKQNNMSTNKKFNLTPSAAAVVSVSAMKLYHLYKSGKFDYLTNKNVASSIDVLNNDDGIEQANSRVTAEGIDDTAGRIGFAQAETTHGKTNLDIEFDPETYQYYPDTCAFQSQTLILREYGFDVKQEDLMQIAKEQGWYVEGYGTPEDKVGKLLEYYGLDTSITEGNNIFNLANELAQGHKILVTVDSGELWAPGLGEKMEDLLIGEQADHALLVVGVDTSDPSDVKVIVTDPGNGNTQYAYSEKEFMDAWKDSNCFMASTNESPEEYFAHQEYPPMSTFADIPYNYIARISESDISIANIDCYHEFYDEFMNNPEELDTLMDEYSDLFENGDDIDFTDGYE